jgi:hypothetical protein
VVTPALRVNYNTPGSLEATQNNSSVLSHLILEQLEVPQALSSFKQNPAKFGARISSLLNQLTNKMKKVQSDKSYREVFRTKLNNIAIFLLFA